MKLCRLTSKIFSKLFDISVTCYQLSRKSRPVFGNESFAEDAAVPGVPSFSNYKKHRQWGLLKTQNLQVSPLNLNRRYMCQCRGLAETKYSPFILTNMEQHGDDTFLYTFEIVNPKTCSLDLLPGQHMYLRSDKVSKKGWLERPYNVIQSQSSSACMQALIYLSPTGSLTEWIKNWHLGQITWWRGPFGRCPLKPDIQQLGLIGQWAGISPMMGVTRHLLCNIDPDEPPICIKLFFCTSNHCNIFFRKELNEFLKYSNFKYDIFLSDQKCPFKRLCKENIYEKTLDGNDLKCYVNSIDDNDCQFLICGDPMFKNFVAGYLECFGIDKDKIHKF